MEILIKIFYNNSYPWVPCMRVGIGGDAASLLRYFLRRLVAVAVMVGAQRCGNAL